MDGRRILEEECMGSEEVEASLLRLIKNLTSEVICFLDQCYVTSALFDSLVQVLYTGIALFLLGRYLPIIKLN